MHSLRGFLAEPEPRVERVEGGHVAAPHSLEARLVADRIARAAGAFVIEGAGLTVYPGLIDSYTNLGVPEPAASAELCLQVEMTVMAVAEMVMNLRVLPKVHLQPTVSRKNGPRLLSYTRRLVMMR